MSNHSLFSNIFGSNDNQKSSKKAQQRRRGRTLRIEELESREMLDAGLMAALDDAFKSSTPENETVIVETGNTVSGSSVVSGSPVAPAQADEPYPTPTNLHIYAHTSKTLTPAWDNMYSDYGATEYVLQWRAKGTFPNWDSPDHFTRVPFTITEYRISGLTPQTTYEIRVAAVYDNQFSQWSGTIEWTTDEPEPPDQRPAPENLRVSDTVLPTKDTIRLVWDSVEGAAAVNGYSVQYRKTADGPNAAWLLVSSGYDTFATVTGLAHDTEYEFRVRTNFSRFSEGGEGESDWSGSITGRTLPLVLPGIPVNLHSDTQTASIITLDWAAAANASRYQYQYCRTGTNNWTQEFITVDTSVTFFGFDSATSYDFRVRTENSDGISDWATFSVSTKAASETFIPAVPTATRSTNQTVYTLDVAWDSVLLAQNYTVQYRAANTTSWTSIQAAYNTARVYELVADTTYEFQVQARNSDGESGWSGIFQAKTNPLVMPDAPKNFKQTGRTAHGVTLEWDSVEGAYAYFIEYRRAGAGDDAWAAVPHTGATAGLYYQSPVNIGDNYVLQLDGGTEYEFRIKTLIREQRTAEFNGYLEYESVWSEPVKASTEPLLPVTVPSRLREFAKTDTTITMRFDAVPVDNPGNFQHSYEMRYRPAGSGEEDWVMSWVPAPANGNSMFSGLTAGTEYEFQIRAHNPNPIRQLTSDWSASVFVTTTGGVVTLPAVPTGLTSTNTTANSVTVTWTGVSNATSYEFQYRKAGAEWPADSTPTSQPSRVVNALDAETTYEFRVRAVNTAGESDWSESISVTTEAGGVVVTPPAVPTGLTSTAKTANSVTLSWTGVSTATSYGVQWKTSTGTWSTQGVTINGTTATVTGLAADTEYEFQVKAVNSDGESNWSGSVPVTTETEGTTPTPPAVPTGLTNTGKTRTSLAVAWESVAGATGYVIQYKTVDEEDWTSRDIDFGVTSYYVITDLIGGTEYEFRIGAVKDGATSVPSESMTAKTSTAAVPQSTAHSAIQKLQAGTKDALNKIAAVKKTATLSTLTFDLPAQSLMKGTAADGYTQILIQVWAPKNKATGKVGLLTSITVQVSQDSTGKVIYGEVESTYIDTKAEIKGGQLVLSGLDAGTKYTLQIQAVKNTNTITFNRDGKPTNVADGSKVLNVAGTTVKYPAVKPLKVDTAASAPFIKGVTTNSVALYWQAPKVTGQPLDAPIIKDTSWVIEVKDARGKEVVKSAVYGQVTGKGTVSDPYKVTITGLPEINTKYTVFVTAVSTLMNNDVISSAQSKVSPKTAKV